jgi:hypothetical protein
MMNQLPNSLYTASLDEVIEKLYNAAADRQLPSVTVLEQSSDGTIPVKLVVSRSFLLHEYIYIVLCSALLASVLCLNTSTSGVCNLIFIINWIVRDKKYNNIYKHKHIHSLIIRNTQNDFDFVFNR